MSSTYSGEGDGETPAETGTTLRVRLYDGESATITDAFFLKVPTASIDDGDLLDLRAEMAGSKAHREYALLRFCDNNGATVEDHWTAKEYLESIVEVEPQGTTIQTVFLKKATRRTPVGRTFPSSDQKRCTRHPADLRENEWAMLAQSNSLLYGFTITRGSPEKDAEHPRKDGKFSIRGIERAKLPAFRFKERKINAFELSNDLANDAIELRFCIPDFVVDDRSYVSVFDTGNQLQSTLAKASFSELDIKASTGSGVFGIEVGAFAGYGKTSRPGSPQVTMKASKELHVVHAFPRVTLNLDEHSLELTPQCADALKGVDDKASLTEFLRTFGEFFTTKVQLGGRLYASEEMTPADAASLQEAKQSMRATASASFNSSRNSGPVSARPGTGSSGQEGESPKSLARPLCWEASGGDPLLCSKCESDSTQSPQQEKVHHMIDILAKFPGREQLQSQIKDLPNKAPPQPPRFRLTLVDDVPRKRPLNLTAIPPSEFTIRRVAEVSNEPATESAWSDNWYGDYRPDPIPPEAGEVGEVGFWSFRWPEYDRLGLVNGNDDFEAYDVLYQFPYRLTGGDAETPLYVSSFLADRDKPSKVISNKLHCGLSIDSGDLLVFEDAAGDPNKHSKPIRAGALVTVRIIEVADSEKGYVSSGGDDLRTGDDDTRSPITTLGPREDAIVFRYQPIEQRPREGRGR
ncbi:hypothetical protein PG996_009153 [Apiospora saccharicola]|uniref:MACPF domain-containing protein n=1 Tax=Apiospora saccharicola TaxID=335842 RepID=A0ABR1UMV4_9PEZI